MAIFFAWLVFSLLVGAIGSGRKIGFGGAFFLSLLLSPIIGLIFALASKDKTTAMLQEEMLKERMAKTSAEAEDAKREQSLSDEYQKLLRMRDEGILNEEDFQALKRKLLL